MPDDDQVGADFQVDPKSPHNVHDDHASGKGNKSNQQTPVSQENPGDPTRDTWKKVDRDKVVTTKEEMPSPRHQKND